MHNISIFTQGPRFPRAIQQTPIWWAQLKPWMCEVLVKDRQEEDGIYIRAQLESMRIENKVVKIPRNLC